ncbi:MAG: hypothetical protein AAFQ64_08095 [Pseudomonadota bacterium]
MNVRMALAGLLICAVSACGGSNTSSEFDLESYDAIAAQGDALALEIGTAQPTPLADLGSVGAATYKGALFLNVPSAPTIAVLGEARLNVDLTNGTVDGVAGNFFTLIEEPAAGLLTFSNGQVSGTTQANLSADVSGEIAFEDTSRVIDATLSAAVIGEEGDYVSGTVIGTGTTQDSVDGAVTGNILLAR